MLLPLLARTRAPPRTRTSSSVPSSHPTSGRSPSLYPKYSAALTARTAADLRHLCPETPIPPAAPTLVHTDLLSTTGTLRHSSSRPVRSQRASRAPCTFLCLHTVLDPRRRLV